MSVYPGYTDNFTNHLGYESIRTSDTEASSWIACRPDLLDEHGDLHSAVIGYLVDSTAGVVCGMAAVPRWVVTADLQFRIVCPTTVGPVRADATAVRPGRRQSLGEVRVVDEGAGERVVAWGTVNHLVIERDDDLEVPADMPVGVRYGPAHPLTAAPDPLATHFGVRSEIDSGVAELDVVGDAVNPLGILHGGLLALLAGTAARSLVPDGRTTRITDMTLRFVGAIPRERVARAEAEIVSDGRRCLAARVAIGDPEDPKQRVGTLAMVGIGYE